ncbi:MAG: DedA family protein [Sandaracinus sp.]|nr:DedA family protein [Sandaracinus sp.]|tara:strand:- start:685 stop:1275 length:591 start_codon:yes stop_codon:yes gene_type:complete
MEEAGSVTDEPQAPSKLRLVLLGVFMAGLFVFGWASGWADHFTLEGIRDAIQSAGAWGIFLFIGAFAVGELLHVPGVVFVAAAVLAYGELVGGITAYVGALVSVAVSFGVVRGVGGRALGSIGHPRVRKILDRLEERPVRVVALLRLILWVAPPLNYALALSPVRFRDYMVGSAIGLVIPLTLAALFLDWLVSFLL